jgi:NADH dehydrogenase FAD-containing subunit
MEHSAQHNREAATKALLNFGVSVNTHTSVEEVRSDRTVVLRDSTTDCTYESTVLLVWLHIAYLLRLIVRSSQ